MEPNPSPRAEDTGEYLQCRVCGKPLRFINSNHLKKHLMTCDEYKRRFGVGFVLARDLREQVSTRKSKGRSAYVARDKDEILAALREYAKGASPLSYRRLRQLDVTLVTQAERAFGSWRAALDAAGVRRRHRKEWSDEGVLRALDARRRAGKPMNAAALQSQDAKLHQAAVRRFGSYRAALDRLGLDYDRVKRLCARDDQTYRRDLLEWCAKHGPLNPKGLIKTARNLYMTAIRKHGGVEEAAHKFGLPYRAERRHWTRDSIAEELRWIHRKHGPLGRNKVQRIDGALYQAVCRHYGSVKKAAEELLLPVEPAQRSWDREQVVRAIRQRAGEGKSLAYQVVRQEESTLVAAAERLFGGWAKAREAGGIDCMAPKVNRAWTDQAVLEEVRQRHREGKSLKGKALFAEGNSSLYGAAMKRFGSWGAAVKAAGFDYETIRGRRWTDQAVLDEIRARHARGDALGDAALNRDRRTDLLDAARRRFGSWKAAVYAAGIDYEPIRGRRWTDQAVLDEIKARHVRGETLGALALARGGRRDLLQAGQKRFGSWKAAVEAAGLDYQVVAGKLSAGTGRGDA